MDIGFQLFIFEKRSFEIPLLATFASISLQCNNMGNMLSKPVSAKNNGIEALNVDRMVSSCCSQCSFCLYVFSYPKSAVGSSIATSHWLVPLTAVVIRHDATLSWVPGLPLWRILVAQG
jgi:hypothetical protein